MSRYHDVSYSVSDGVVRVAVNRPAKLNAYRNQTADELRAAITEAGSDRDVRAILLTGEGRAFGAGYDLSTIDPGETPALDDVLERHFNPLVETMRASRLPIVAAVNGPCAGAAVGIALAADIVIAARSAYFYEPFVGIALVPDAGNTLFLSRILGRIRASGMMLLGDRITAERALQWGLVWEIVEDRDLQAAALTICARLAALDANAVTATKQLIADAADFGASEQLQLERDLQGEAGRSPAMKARIAEFFERRKE
ncbi:acyl-CoA hydratase [Mesorhizobium plurifarium]|uniref:Acyl-CoA hydratase n=1 Tax=Mesorhizobium plurifarium TaxID=69974 RepID=A0A0K2W0N8_MESPL|nr:acyl-CoA hydratase [Mesorhizobium plurifarium]